MAGVAGGLSERLGLDPLVIRAAFVVLSFAGGAGVVLYLLGWLLATDPAVEKGPPPSDRAALPPTQQVVSVALVVAGLLLLLRAAGIWFGDALVWPVALSAFGATLLWARSDETGRARWTRLASRLPRRPMDVIAGQTSRGRIIGGGLLIVAGMAAFLAEHVSLRSLGNVAFAVVVTVLGLVLILGPWIWQLARQLTTERRERIRSEERADMAAHLHDSVLQTLALIQRSSSPKEMSALARGQERELRAWLYGRTPVGPGEPALLSVTVEEMAARMEGLHGITVEAVTVGDCPMDERLRALIDATGEAMQNAARHSGADRISVYVEVEQATVTAYVRDAGRGFDPTQVPPARRGVAESIVGRMERIGGTATLVTAPDRGTEWRLSMPRRLP